MEIDFLNKNKIENLEVRARAILGIPEELLDDLTISSPDFLLKASKYINKKIKNYEGIEIPFVNIAYVYYICYLLCPGMYARLPKQMENLSTKTVLQAINWDEKAVEMLNKCNEVLDDAIAELEGNDESYTTTFATLSNASEYPNTNI